jgi:hypothetical protein
MKFLLVMMGLLIVGCGKDSVRIDVHGDRITELERRADLNDQLDAARDILIASNSSQIVYLEGLLSQLDNDLRQLISDEEQARMAGDTANANALMVSIAAQSFVNFITQLQIASLGGNISSLSSQISSLQSQVNDINVSISIIETNVSSIQSVINNLPSSFISQSDLDDLEQDILNQVNALILANGSGVVVIKPCLNAAEVLFRIGGTLYGAMNHKAGNGNNSALKNVALEALPNGTYSTTSGSGNCTFTVQNGLIL